MTILEFLNFSSGRFVPMRVGYVAHLYICHRANDKNTGPFAAQMSLLSQAEMNEYSGPMASGLFRPN
jgi:hypothetical protein